MKLAMPAQNFRKFGRCLYSYQKPNRLFFTKKIDKCTYQVRDQDPETGKEAFQLGLWDGRIGRWLTTDPKYDGNSPYWGMNNNPITIVDPDGGSGEKAEDIFKLQEDGTIKLIERTNDNFDTLLDKDDVHIGQVNKGFLSDGLNMRKWFIS